MQRGSLPAERSGPKPRAPVQYSPAADRPGPPLAHGPGLASHSANLTCSQLKRGGHDHELFLEWCELVPDFDSRTFAPPRHLLVVDQPDGLMGLLQHLVALLDLDLQVAMVCEYLEGLTGAEVQVVAVFAQVNEEGFHDGLAGRRLMHVPSSLKSPRCTCCKVYVELYTLHLTSK